MFTCTMGGASMAIIEEEDGVGDDGATNCNLMMGSDYMWGRVGSEREGHGSA